MHTMRGGTDPMVAVALVVTMGGVAIGAAAIVGAETGG
jgi:hypothetical protein